MRRMIGYMGVAIGVGTLLFGLFASGIKGINVDIQLALLAIAAIMVLIGREKVVATTCSKCGEKVGNEAVCPHCGNVRC